MTNWADEIADEERAEVIAKLNKAAQILTDTAASIKQLAASTGDYANISDDAFVELVSMLRELSDDYDIAVMCEDAQQVEDAG